MDVTRSLYLMISPLSRPFCPVPAAKGRERPALPAVGLLCNFLYCVFSFSLSIRRSISSFASGWEKEGDKEEFSLLPAVGGEKARPRLKSFSFPLPREANRDFYLRRSRQVKARKVLFFFFLLLLLLGWPLSFHFPNVHSKGVWKEKSLSKNRCEKGKLFSIK